MAQKKTPSRGSNSRGRQSGNGSRPAEGARRSKNQTDREYRRYVSREESDPGGPPDVLLDVPELRIDLIHFELDDLDAHLAVKANVLNLIKLNVGIDVHLSRVKLDVKGVEAEAVLKARLDHVTAIVDRLMTSLDRNPELVEGLSRAISEIGQGAGEAVDETGDAAKDIGKGAEGALQDVGQGAGQAVGDVGEGAGQAVGDIGQGAGQAVGDVGQGAGQAVGNIGQGAGQAAGQLDQLVGGASQTLGQLGEGAGQAVGGLEQTLPLGGGGQAAQGGGSANGGLAQGGAEGQPDGGTPGAPGSGDVAKVVVKTVAREIKHAATDEARDLGLAAARKVREFAERREHRRAEKHNATEPALQMADELGVDLAEIDGTGSGGRITVKDVQRHVQQLQEA
jgi:e3 binding domain